MILTLWEIYLTPQNHAVAHGHEKGMEWSLAARRWRRGSNARVAERGPNRSRVSDELQAALLTSDELTVLGPTDFVRQRAGFKERHEIHDQIRPGRSAAVRHPAGLTEEGSLTDFVRAEEAASFAAAGDRLPRWGLTSGTPESGAV